LEDLAQHFAVALADFLEAAETRVLRPQRMRLAPVADGVTIEVVARLDGGVHGVESEAVGGEEGGLGGGGGGGCRRRCRRRRRLTSNERNRDQSDRKRSMH